MTDEKFTVRAKRGSKIYELTDEPGAPGCKAIEWTGAHRRRKAETFIRTISAEVQRK